MFSGIAHVPKGDMYSAGLITAVATTLYPAVGWWVLYKRVTGVAVSGDLGKLDDAVAAIAYAAGWWLMLGAARGTKPWQALLVPILFLLPLVFALYLVLVVPLAL